MRTARLLLPLVLVAVVALPLAFPVVDLARHPGGWSVVAEADRLGTLTRNSLILATTTVLVAVPLGVVVAFLLERTHVWGGGILHAVVVCGLFIPLSVYAAAWRAAVGGDWFGSSAQWRPWSEGLGAAAAIHAVAGLPWVVWLVALALRTTDPRLEEDAMLAGGPRAAFRWALWPRALVGAVAGGCVVAVQTLTEITVTDLMLVRTFAEEVYTQLVSAPDGVAAATAVTVPVWGLAAVVAVALARRVAWAAPIGPAPVSSPRHLLPSRRVRAFATLGLWVGFALVVGVPIAGLVMKVGGIGALVTVSRAHGLTLLVSLFWGLVAGMVVGALALPACWYARTSGCLTGAVFGLAAVAWITPAPLVGLGLKGTIDLLLSVEDIVLTACGFDLSFPPLRSSLYDQPSPLPAVWVMMIRFFPVAIAILWPVVRALPCDLIDAAQLDGPGALWCGVVWPLTRAACGRAVIAVGVLGSAEVVAVKLVEPPGRQTFSEELFHAMHYGADTTVAAMCLLQILATAMVCGIILNRLSPWRANRRENA
jgi:iron(III) transport system permease protein